MSTGFIGLLQAWWFTTFNFLGNERRKFQTYDAIILSYTNRFSGSFTGKAKKRKRNKFRKPLFWNVFVLSHYAWALRRITYQGSLITFGHCFCYLIFNLTFPIKLLNLFKVVFSHSLDLWKIEFDLITIHLCYLRRKYCLLWGIRTSVNKIENWCSIFIDFYDLSGWLHELTNCKR